MSNNTQPTTQNTTEATTVIKPSTKVALIKEVDQWGNILYSIEKDGFYVSNSVTGGCNMNDPEEKRTERYNEAYKKYHEYLRAASFEKTRVELESTLI